MPRKPKTKIQRIHAVPHFHFDLEWWKTEPGYAADTAGILDEAVTMLEQHPEFTFVLDQATAIKPWWDANPQVHAQVKDWIREGRIECVGGTWAAPDENIPTGEALIRNFLLGRRFFEKEMEAPVCTAWEIDEFGHPEQMPQIFTGCGFSQFVFARGVPMHKHTEHPTEFTWQAPDGSTILTHWMAAHYTGLVPFFNPLLNRISFTRELRARLAMQGRQSQSPHMFVPMGTDFQTPQADWLEFLPHWNRTRAEELEFSLPHRFFDAVRRDAPALPLVSGEFNPLLTGCYESREKIKRGCRVSQHGILEAEKLASVCHAMGWMPWPAKKFQIAWENILKNDFHDTICGTGTDAVYRDSLKRYDTAEAAIGDIRASAVRTLARNVDTKGAGSAILIFNSLNHAREEVVCAPIGKKLVKDYASGKSGPLAAYGPDGAAAPCQVCGDKGLFRAAAPSVGYSVYHIRPARKKDIRQWSNPFRTDGLTLDNGLVRITLDPRTGGIASLADSASGAEFLDPEDTRLMNGLVVEEDAGNLWTVQKTGRVWDDCDFPAPDIRVLQTGPVCAVVEVSGEHRDMQVRRRIILHAGSPRIDFVTNIDFKGRDLRVKAHFNMKDAHTTVFETPFCATERPAGHHCAQNWVDLAARGRGLAVFNSGNPGHDAAGNSLDLVLMRSVSVFPAEKIARFVGNNLPAVRRGLRDFLRHSIKGLGVNLGEWDMYDFHGLMLREWSSAGPPPDSKGKINLMDHLRPMLTPDQPADCWERGAHTFRYAALPHAGGFRGAALPLHALAFNTPLLAVPVKKSAGHMPATHSFLSTGPDPAVLLTALKKCESGAGLAARACDAHGHGAALRIKTSLPLDAPVPADMLENPQTPKSNKPARAAKTKLPPWRIQTFVMEKAAAQE